MIFEHFILLFRPKSFAPSQLLRSVRSVNSQFRGYGQQVKKLNIDNNCCVDVNVVDMLPLLMQYLLEHALSVS